MQGHTKTAMGFGSEHASKVVTEVVEQTGLCQLTPWQTGGYRQAGCVYTAVFYKGGDLRRVNNGVWACSSHSRHRTQG